jgi:nitrous oxidase accessory protein NosD
MSYTLRGRLESRLAALAAPLAAACLLAIVLRAWWPLELSAAMAALLLGLDLVYHPLLRYQPGWAALPLGLLEVGALMGIAFAFEIQPPLGGAFALFAGGWLAAQILGHALLPLWRVSYAEDGGQLGRAGPVLAVAVALPFVVGATYWYANLPPVVHLGAGVHRGPLVIDRREHLVGEPGAIVVGGIVVRHSDVTVSHVRVVGGENGITVDGYRNVHLDHVSVAHSTLDGIHVRNTAVTVRHCDVDMDGSPFGQGVDISFGMGSGESVVEDCRVSGGQQGILIDSAMAMVEHNVVTGTTLRAISMDEMSMGGLSQNSVRHANGVGIYCNDHSMCMVDGNRVSGTRSDAATGDRTRAGFGLVVDFGAEAETAGNDLVGNPRQVGVFLDGQVRKLRE